CQTAGDPVKSDVSRSTQTGVEHVAESVAKHVEAEDSERNGDTRPDGHQGCTQHVRAAGAREHAAPRRVGGGTPKPRNESADSARIAVPRPIVPRMMIVAMTLGST